MKDKLVASISVLLPSVQLIINRQRHTLLKATIMIRRQPTYHTSHLHSQTDIKILRDMRVRPPLSDLIRGIDKRNTLDSLPSQKRIVAHERRDIASANTILDGCVHNVGEVCDAVLKDVMRNLHDA